MKIYQHHGVDIVIRQAESRKWVAMWIFPGEDETVRAERESESQALGYAQKQIDQCLEANADTPDVLKVGDKVLRKNQRDSYHMGTIVEIRGEHATVAWPSRRIGGNGTQKSRLLLTTLVPTTEEECRRRAREAAAARKLDYERRFAPKGGAEHGAAA